ncbi:MAG: daunorubicin resistance protein DrrA family ABC transporter ATP-binding protein [Acidimicrobiia bacterium]|nr:MAG: daunorubicin resistance protein DrrA family ABC transporter ATP-binding protein [Acidimicrobiia bacterium]
MTPAISFSSVHKTFGDVHALDNVGFDAPAGSVTVLLGPNGAGKTTTVRLTTGALIPDSGTIRVLGLDPLVDGDHVRSRVGVVPPKPAFYDQLTGWENLQFAATIFQADEDSARSAAERFDIDHALEQEVAGYSTGMRTRLALARAVIHDPDVLMLDEPTAGLDPESARAVLELITELAGKGRTILMCTHLLHEAEGIADQVVLMDQGQVRAHGDPRDLARAYMPDPIIVIDAEDRTSLDFLGELDGVLAVRNDNALYVTVDFVDRVPDIVIEMVKRGVRPTRIEPLNPTLEDLYFEMQRAHRGES